MKYFLVSLITAFFLVSCTKSQPKLEQTLVVALESKPKTLDPRFATDANGQRISSLLFQSLVRLGPDLEIVGELASHWEVGDKFVNFKIPRGLKFSDGSLITQEDILFSINEYRKPTNIFSNAYKNIKELKMNEKESYWELTFLLNSNSATLLVDLSPLKIMPKTKIESLGKDFYKDLVGSGPYSLKKQTNNQLHLVKNPHFSGKVNNEGILFKVIKDDNTRYLRMIKGDIDLAPSVLSASSIKKIEQEQKFYLEKSPGLAMNYILINLQNPALGDKNFRLALAHALDRSQIIKFKLEGLALPATSILSPGNPFFDDSMTAPEFDLEKAKEYLAKSKSKPEKLIIKSSNTPSVVENAKVLANQFSKLGIKTDIQSFEWGTFYGDIKNGNFQLATMRWVGATDPDIYRIAFHSKELPPGRNRGYYQNTQLDQLLDQGRSVMNPEKRISLYKKVQKQILKDLPIIPLWYNTQTNVVNKRVSGFKASKNGDFSYFPLFSVSE
ncbi:MAG: ABC transporter substrate-binding protein [Bdellovibrionales bacterium]